MSGKIWVLIPVVVFFTWMGTAVMDPDFGWHYRLGELILKTGIPKTDPFSYTMPSYPFVDYEWGSNLLIYLGEKYLGGIMTAAIWAAIAVYTFWVAVPIWGKKYWWWAVWLGLSVAAARFAIRPQVLSWLFTAIVVRMLFDETVAKKWKWGLVPLIWVWANLHGSYLIGLGLWCGWWGVKMLRMGKIFWTEMGIGVAATIVTLINPYGLRNWQEILMQMGQTRLFAATLEEWRPFWDKVDLGMMAIVAWLLAMGWRYRKALVIEEIVVGLAALTAGLSSLRHGVLTMVILAPISIKLWLVLKQDLGKTGVVLERWRIFEKGAVAITAAIIILELSLLVRNHVKGYGWKFPDKAVSHLQTAGYPKKLMADYGWGGYLIRKMPGERVFIDGRMSGWWWKGADGESEHAYMEYLMMVGDPERNAQKTLDKYGINTVLWRKQEKVPEGIWGQKMNEWGLWADQGGRLFELWLEQNGWKKVYEDEVSAVYINQVM